MLFQAAFDFHGRDWFESNPLDPESERKSVWRLVRIKTGGRLNFELVSNGTIETEWVVMALKCGPNASPTSAP